MPLPFVWTAKVKARASRVRESIYEIRSSGQVRQNPWACNRRYRGQCSTYSDALFLPHHFRGDRVPVSGWVQLGLDSVVVKGACSMFSPSRYHPSALLIYRLPFLASSEAYRLYQTH